MGLSKLSDDELVAREEYMSYFAGWSRGEAGDARDALGRTWAELGSQEDGAEAQKCRRELARRRKGAAP